MRTDDQPCPESGRRRAANARKRTATRTRPSRNRCDAHRRLPDPDHEAFIDWFVTYWHQRGAELFNDKPAEEVPVEA